MVRHWPKGGQCEKRRPKEWDNKHGLKSLKRTGRRIKGFGLSRGAGAKKLSVHNPFDSGPLKCMIWMFQTLLRRKDEREVCRQRSPGPKFYYQSSHKKVRNSLKNQEIMHIEVTTL